MGCEERGESGVCMCISGLEFAGTESLAWAVDFGCEEGVLV